MQKQNKTETVLRIALLNIDVEIMHTKRELKALENLKARLEDELIKKGEQEE